LYLSYIAQHSIKPSQTGSISRTLTSVLLFCLYALSLLDIPMIFESFYRVQDPTIPQAGNGSNR
jgi:hypothetical protein